MPVPETLIAGIYEHQQDVTLALKPKLSFAITKKAFGWDATAPTLRYVIRSELRKLL
jgi:hypothetical protein